MKRQALIASISRYDFLKDPYGKKLHLKTPAKDGEAIAQALEQATNGLAWRIQRLPQIVQDGKYIVDSNQAVREHELSSAIHQLLYPDTQYVEKDSVVLLFFSGHGLRKQNPDGTFEGFLATSDANGKDKWGVSLSWLRDQLINSRVKKQIIWLDCCHSGELVNFLTSDELENWLSGGDRCLITACRSDLGAVETKEYGILTEILLQALKPNQVKGGWISTWTITSFVRQQSETNPLLKPQIPQFRHFGDEIRLWKGEKLNTLITHLHQDWGEAPDVSVFFGRTKELADLEQWIVRDKCRLVAILGIGGIGKTRLSVKLGKSGIGKTDLSLKLAKGIQDEFEYVIWRRLLNAPPVIDILADLIKFLSNQQEIRLPKTVDDRISRLLHYLKSHRCLIILDNVETVLKDGDYAGKYREGYEGYGKLFQQIGEVPHQSCLLLTSREKPQEIARLAGKTKPTRFMELGGLNYSEGKQIFSEIGNFVGDDDDWKKLIEFYNGNPLALELSAHHINEVFSGNISKFLAEEKFLFNDIRDLLNWHYKRLSFNEKEIMYWLAINREPVSVSELKEDIVSPEAQAEVSTTLQSLQRRIPLEINSGSFTLQPVLMEYMTERLINEVYDEIDTKDISLLNSHALMKATAKEYIREMQVRLIIKPIIVSTGKKNLEVKLNKILSILKEKAPIETGYLGGNILNFFVVMQADLTGYDFSCLIIKQAYLQEIILHEVNFANADLSKSIFTETLGCVSSVAFSLDGNGLVTGDDNNEVSLWRIADSQQVFTCKGHTNWVRSIAFSPDGQTLASSSEDQMVKLWNAETGQHLQTLQGHTSSVRGVAFSPDGKTLASSSHDQTIKLWDISTYQCIKTLEDHTDWVWSIDFSPNGKILVSSSGDSTIKLWDAETGQCIKTLEGHIGRVRSVTFSPDGKILASGSDDQKVKLWDVETYQCTNILQGHTSRIRSVTFSPDGKIVASGSDDKKVKLWNACTGEHITTLEGHVNLIRSVTFSPDGNILASGSDDHTVRLWDINTSKCIKIFQGYTNFVWSVNFSPDGKILASGCEDRIIRFWDIQTGECLKTLQKHPSRIRSITFSQDRKLLAIGNYDQTAWLWDIQTDKCFQTLQGHINWVWTVSFSPDSKTVVTGSHDKTVRLWDVQTGQCLKIFEGHTHPVTVVKFSPDGQILASGSEDKTLRVWDIHTGLCLKIFAGHTDWIWTFAFSPDGQTIASGSHDQTIKLWDVHSGQCLKTFQGHKNWVRSVTFSPDGQTIASGSHDQTVKLWDVHSAQCLKTFPGHNNWVLTVDFNPQGNILVSGSQDNTLKLWQVETGDCLGTLKNKRPCEGMNITNVQGLTEAQKATLKVLGAFD